MKTFVHFLFAAFYQPNRSFDNYYFFKENNDCHYKCKIMCIITFNLMEVTLNHPHLHGTGLYIICKVMILCDDHRTRSYNFVNKNISNKCLELFLNEYIHSDARKTWCDDPM
jgi:hypothetical protein